jgi:hypothetical protein
VATGKVFGIGLNKTGTRSVAAALRILGYRTLHNGSRPTTAAVDRAADENQPLLTYIGDGYDAYFDVVGLVHRFEDLDAQYPGSRFILTTRNEEDWLRSREKHATANQERTGYDGPLLTVDREAWMHERNEHHAKVAEYFKARDDLLVFDVAAGDGWEKLAPFLGRKPPTRPFPWANREGEGTYAPEHKTAAWKRRIDYALGRVRRKLRA